VRSGSNNFVSDEGDGGSAGILLRGACDCCLIDQRMIAHDRDATTEGHALHGEIKQQTWQSSGGALEARSR
jgi:hypothetical protein